MGKEVKPSISPEVVRWSVGRKKEVVLRLLRGESIDALSRELGIEAYQGVEAALKERGGDPAAADHFQNQIKFWGIAPSFAYVAEPETNGVAERFYRTLKEQVIYGRTYRIIEELRIALADFIERYNKYWLVEKLGFKSPRQAYNEHQLMAVA